MRILFTFIFICVQLFAYCALGTAMSENYNSQSFKKSAYSVFNPQNGTLQKAQSDLHFVCQNILSKSHFLNKNSQNTAGSAYVPDFRLNDAQKIKNKFENSLLTYNISPAYHKKICARAP